MTLRKKILFYTLLTLLTLAVLEGISRLAYYLAFAESYPLPPTLSAAADRPGLTRHIQPPPRRTRLVNNISHPYYGFTAHSPISPLNVMPPPQTGPDTVVVALLGGSVAWDVIPYFQQALTRHFADQGLPKEPVLVQLPGIGMKQPQQLHIASFMLAMGGNFDILVNLDGYNELVFSYDNFNKDVFPFFPTDWKKMVSLTQEQIALAGQIRAARGQLAQLHQAGPVSPFRYTALYGILHRYQIQQAQTRISQLNYALANQVAARSREQRGAYIPFHNAAQVHQESVRVWYRSSALLSRLADTADADYYHFLQPNQYIPNSKPLSSKEQRDYYYPDRVASADYANTYPLLQQFGQELQQQGINYFDLTQIFNDHSETLYRDECCHLNPKGNELLAAAMVQRLEPALRRHAAAPNPEPASPLTVAAPLSRPAAPPTLPAPSSAALATEPHFQVTLRPGNLLLYVKNNCRPEHTASPFFLHIIPANAADLPPDRHRHGFQSRDFSFPDGGVRSGHWGGNNSCVIERILPNYLIASLRTGQFNPAGEIWSTELPLAP